MRSIFLSLAICFAFLVSGPVAAKTTHSWKVVKVTGQAWFAAKNRSAVRVKRGMLLNPGVTLSTKARSRVLLSRNKERMQVSPNSIIAIPPTKYLKDGKTLILQQAGQLDIAARKRDIKHFSVHTPYLAAVVKGTQFTVRVQNRKADVSVQSGSVEVSSHVSGESTNIARGQQASINVQNAKSAHLKVNAKAGAKKPKIFKRVKRKAPRFFATVKVKGKIKELAPGANKKMLTDKERNTRQLKRNAIRNKAKKPRSFFRRSTRNKTRNNNGKNSPSKLNPGIDLVARSANSSDSSSVDSASAQQQAVASPAPAPVSTATETDHEFSESQVAQNIADNSGTDFTGFSSSSPSDSSSSDSGSSDSGSTDSGSTDSGSTDSGSTDSGSTDSGSTDSGSTDSGSSSGSSWSSGSWTSPGGTTYTWDNGGQTGTWTKDDGESGSWDRTQ